MGKSNDYRVPFGEHLIDLADGRTAGPGDVVSLSAEDLKDPHNQRLIEEGKLLAPEEKPATRKQEEGS